MKIAKYIILLLPVAAMLSGCTLERVSYEEIYKENLYRNDSDVQKSVTGLYELFTTGWGKFYCADQWGYVICTDMTTGQLTSKWQNQGYQAFYEHRWSETGSDLATQFSQKIYPQYKELTRIKNTIDDIAAADITPAVKVQAIAEAKCLYGWIGYIMYDLFGPVPLATDEARDNPTAYIYIPRLSDEEYTAEMISMLDDAIEDLPWRNESWGHVTKGMALMLKLKFLMMNHDFEAAEPVARQLYEQEGNVYALLPDYASVFTKSNARNNEIIHAIPAGESNPNYWITQTTWGDVPGYEGENWATFLMQWSFYDSFEENDQRKNTIVAEYTSTTTGAVVKRGAGNLQYGCCPIKIGQDPDRIGSRGTTDVIVFRYADVLLSLAECINENNSGPTQEAISLVNRIRNRVGLSDLTSDKTADKVSFNTAILNERLHEFYCEGLSRSDKIRHGTFVSDSQTQYKDSQSDWYKVRFPIPSSYINESKGIVKQNDGYSS